MKATMQVITQSPDHLLVRFDQGEEVISQLAALAKQEHIPSASFTLIGACSEIILSFYNLPEKRYEDQVYQKDLEITGVLGNIAWMQGQPIIHAHGTVADNTHTVWGGHIKKLVISATGEVYITLFPENAERAYDEITGLNLFCIAQQS